MRVVNVPMRRVLNLPFATPVGRHLMLPVADRSLADVAHGLVVGAAGSATGEVQESWLRWADIGDAARDEVRDPRAYLVRMVSRQALNRLPRSPGSARTTSGSGCPSRF
jgi:hypothetical protein